MFNELMNIINLNYAQYMNYNINNINPYIKNLYINYTIHHLSDNIFMERYKKPLH